MFTDSSLISLRNFTHSPPFCQFFLSLRCLKTTQTTSWINHARSRRTVMPAEFGLAMSIFVVIASMVGVGVLTTSGYTMALVGSNQFMLVLWVVGGVIAVCGALTLAELSAALPHTGGDYVYLYHAFGPLAAFLSGWVSFLIGFSGPCAASAFASAKYILAPCGLEGNHAGLIQRMLATLAILVLRRHSYLGTDDTPPSAGTWITGLKVAFLCLLIVAGLAIGWPHRANFSDARPLDRQPVPAP